MKITRNVLAAIAVLFGLLTLFAGCRVLLGADPGYTVFRPLLVYNTLMGFAYVGAGAIAWRHLQPGMVAAAAIFVLNLIVLAALFMLSNRGETIAVDSLRAMTLRTGVWLVLAVGLGWLYRRQRIGATKPAGA